MNKRPIIFLLIPLILAIILADSFLPVIHLRNHYTPHLSHIKEYKLRIVSEHSVRNKTIRFEAELFEFWEDSIWTKTSGKVLVYFNKGDSLAYNLNYGDIIECRSHIREIENFSDFDYKKMLRRKRIYHNIFVKEKDWEGGIENKGNPLISRSIKTKQYIENRILSSNLGKEESQLAISLLLGDKSHLDPGIIDNFRASGLSHILCVSGLHIGIIMLIFNLVFNFIFQLFFDYRGFIASKIMTILIGFSISFIVGLTPSSLRVATMISILFISKQSSRGYDSINTLFLTAFLFIILNPLVVFNLSFQLSFLAVLGILIYVNITKNLSLRLNYFLRKILNTLGITLSAQVFVLPILLFNFGSFPTYILLANLIIIPFMSILLLCLLLFLLLRDVSIIGTLITEALNLGLSLLIKFVDLINSLPYSEIQFY